MAERKKEGDCFMDEPTLTQHSHMEMSNQRGTHLNGHEGEHDMFYVTVFPMTTTIMGHIPAQREVLSKRCS